MSNEIPGQPDEIVYFPPATPEAQLQACATTLSRLSVLLLPHLGGEAYVTLLDVAELAGNASADPVLSQSEVEAARLIDATVMLASAYLFDHAAAVSSNTRPMPGTSVYARLYGPQGDPYGYRPDSNFGFGAAGDVHAVTHDELNARIEEWQAAVTMLPVATPAEFASLYAIDKKGPYYFTRPLSHDEANHVVRICEAAVPNALYLPINLSHERSCFLMLTNTSSTERTPFMPRTELPQQDFWRALLERGVALLKDNPSLDVFPFDSTQSPFSSSEISAALDELLARNEIAGRANQLPNTRDAVRRDIVNLLARQRLGEEYGAWVARLLERHARHYRRLLGGKYHTQGKRRVDLWQQ